MAHTVRVFVYTKILLLFLMAGVGTAAEGYPLRMEYPDVGVISTEELAQNFNNVLVIDVRSTMEFDVAHINGAKHLSLSKASFIDDLEAIRKKSGSRPIAFYCNGHSCSKSYKACQKAAEEGFINIAAYDAGIFDWVLAHPEKATLRGQTPADKSTIIPETKLKSHMLSFADFKEKARRVGAMTIDIRDPFQRNIVPDIPKLRNIPLDRFLSMVKKKVLHDRELLILDAVGKQVRWLQYYLEDNGYSKYSFLENGVGGI